MRVVDLPMEELEWCKEPQYRLAGVVATTKHHHAVVAERVGPSNADTRAIGDVYCVFVNDDGFSLAGGQVIRKRTQKKTFIKTLKELVDSGWVWDPSINALIHPCSRSFFVQRMFVYFGQEYKDQGECTWSPEMLIEKEV